MISLRQLDDLPEALREASLADAAGVWRGLESEQVIRGRLECDRELSDQVTVEAEIAVLVVAQVRLADSHLLGELDLRQPALATQAREALANGLSRDLRFSTHLSLTARV